MRLIATLAILLFATSAFGQAASFRPVIRDNVKNVGGGGVTSGVPFIHDDDISCSEPNCVISAEPGPAGPQSIEVCEDTDFTLGGNPDCVTITAPVSLPADVTISLAKYTSAIQALTTDFPETPFWGTETMYTPLLPIPVNTVIDVEISMAIYAKGTGFPGIEPRFIGVKPYVQETGLSARFTYLSDTPYICMIVIGAANELGISTCVFRGIVVPDNVTGDDLMEIGLEITNIDSGTLNYKLWGSGGITLPGDVPSSPGSGTAGSGNVDNTWSYTIR